MLRTKTIFLIGLLLLASSALAQFTTVSGTVTDPNGLPYSSGTIVPLLSASTTPTFTATGSAYTPPTQIVGLDSTGSFVMRLADNTALAPGGTKWNFQVCSAAGTVQPAGGHGAVCFSLAAPITISGASQIITTQLNAAAVALTFGGGTGSGTVTSVGTGAGLTGGPIVGAGNISLQVPVAVASGGTGTVSTLAGVARGGNPFTASEISGDCTTSGSNAVTCTKTSGVAFGALATAAAPVPVNVGGTGTTSTLSGIVRGGNPLTGTEISGDCTTSGSNAVTCTKTSGVSFAAVATSGSAADLSSGILPFARLNAAPIAYQTPFINGAANGFSWLNNGSAGCYQGASATGPVWDPNLCSLSGSPNILTYIGTMAATSFSSTGGGAFNAVGNCGALPAVSVGQAGVGFGPGCVINFNNNGAGWTTAGAGTITGVTAGTNLSGGGLSGAVTLNLTPTITITGINSTVYMDGATYPFTSAGLASAITAAGSGGTVVIPASSNLAISGTTTISSPVNFRCDPGSTLTFAVATTHIFAFAQNISFDGCNLIGPGTTLTSQNAPIVAGSSTIDASGFKFKNGSVNGFGATNGNGEIEIQNASHVEISGNKAGDRATGASITVSTASWAAPASGSMLGLETITATAALPGTFALGQSVLCNGIVSTGASTTGYNAPGDGSSSYFGAIMSVASPSFTVQQIYNPGTYASGGTCQVGVGNADWDVEFTTIAPKPMSDWRIFNNDLGEVLVHNSTLGASFSGVIFNANHLHAGMNNKTNEYCYEMGDFSGPANVRPQNASNVVETANDCKIVSDATAGGYSHSTAQNIVESGNNCSGNGHIFSVACDEQVVVNNLSVAAGVLDMLGGGPGEDLNKSTHATISGETILNPAPGATSYGLRGTVTAGGGGITLPYSAYNEVSGNFFSSRVEICPTTVVALTSNNCTIAGLTNVTGTTGVAAFSQCPHPFRVSDTIYIAGAAIANYNTTAGWPVTAVSQGGYGNPCTVSFTLGSSGNAISGQDATHEVLATNFVNKLIWWQCNIAGATCSDNKVAQNKIMGGSNGPGTLTGIQFSLGTGNLCDSNSAIGNDESFVTVLYASSGCTNTHVDFGLVNNFTTPILFAASMTISDAANNPKALIGTGTGVCTSSTTLFLYSLGQTSATTCTATTENNWFVATHAGTVSGLLATSTAGGFNASSGVVTVRKNKANGAITCTFGTGTSCSDIAHSLAVAAGDLISIQVTTQATETLAGVQAKIYLTTQDQ